MGQQTAIEWTDATWNPVRGCSRVSEGCRNCYAERQAARFCITTDPADSRLTIESGPFAGFVRRVHGRPQWTGRVELVESHLADPLHWRKPRKVFVNSMSDLFHEALPDEAIDRVFAVMALCPQHTFQVLTKRAGRMLQWAKSKPKRTGIAWGDMVGNWDHPLPNVWLGVSVENQALADERIPQLLQTPAAIRFVSYEPALGPVDFTRIKNSAQIREFFRQMAIDTGRDPEQVLRECAIDDTPWKNALNGDWFDGWDSGEGAAEKQTKLDWLIVGGESGPGARPFDIRWARDTIAQCKAAGVPCFVKQLGADPFIGIGDQDPAKLQPSRCDGPNFKDRKGGDWDEWPADLRVREFPEARA